MKYKTLLITVLLGAFMFTGCGNTKSRPVQPVQPIIVTPAPPLNPAPEPETEPDTPSVGSGAVSYNPSCESGVITVTYVYQDNQNIDSNSFVITHMEDGVSKDISAGNVMSNGSVSRMQEQVYIQKNETDSQIVHQISVSFITDGVSNVQSWTVVQPTCEVEPVDDNTTLLMTVPIQTI